MKKLTKRIAAMSAAVMMMAYMSVIGASAYSSADTYASATFSISTSATSKSTTKSLKAGNKVKLSNGTTKNIILTCWQKDDGVYTSLKSTSPNGSNTITIDNNDYIEYFITLKNSYSKTTLVKNKITLNNADEDTVTVSGYTRTPK